MSVNVFVAAKTLGECCEWRVSNLTMQKLLYLANLDYMGKNDKPLIDSPFEAWDYGPVQPLLYYKLRRFGARDVCDVFFNEECLTPDDDEKEFDVLNRMSKLWHVKPGVLVRFTHGDGGGWAKVYEPGVMSRIIPNEAIKAEYKLMMEKAKS